MADTKLKFTLIVNEDQDVWIQVFILHTGWF